MSSSPLLAGRFEIRDFLAEGAMGTVYRGYDHQDGVLVAIKHLKKDIIDTDPVIIERFRKEGEVLNRLNHPNIVRMIAAVEAANERYLVMDYIQGGSLRTYLERGTQLDLGWLLHIAIELSDALARAHYLNIIHRDLKPDNVLLADDGTPRLTDFGVARVENSTLTQSGILVGTVAYWSPESFNGYPQDSRSDIWAFGLLLFELLTGQHPFRKSSMMDTIDAILHQPLPMLESLSPETPLAFVDLIYRMVENDRSNRIKSARLVGAELEAILQQIDGSHSSSIYPGLTPDPSASAVEPFTPGKINNLPLETTRFIGREQELAELAGQLSVESGRLLTIVAASGMGKTRLALEVATRYFVQVEDGVIYITLAPLSSANTLITAIMEAVGYPPESVLQDDAQRQLLSYLYSCDLLLVIDNIDNLVDGFNLLAEILEATSKVKILATSHHQLNLSAESIFMLDGLDYPQEGGQENANLFSAVQLFSEGATHTVPDYAPKPGDLEHIAHICRQVQGMPLAIVLAANWTLRLSLSEIDNEISLMISRYSATQVKDHLASTIRWDNEYIMRSDEPG